MVRNEHILGYLMDRTTEHSLEGQVKTKTKIVFNSLYTFPFFVNMEMY